MGFAKEDTLYQSGKASQVLARSSGKVAGEKNSKRRKKRFHLEKEI